MSGVQGGSAVAPVGVFGGTFDPVHFGHLRAALEVLSGCALGSVRLVPVGEPPHRDRPVAAGEQRLQMLLAAVRGEPRLVVDDREVRRAGASFTVDTLGAMRAESPATPLCLLLGADAFLGLPTWRRWQDLATLAHLVVMHRPGTALAPTGELARLLAERRCADPLELRRSVAGRIFEQPITQLDISSSAIRAMVARGGDPRFLVPDAVRDQLMASDCYRQTAEVQVRA